MQLHIKHALLIPAFLTAFAACTADDIDEPTATITRPVESDPCTADTVLFKSWDEVRACEKANPAFYLASTQAVVKTGEKCTAQDMDGTCTSIEPISPEAERYIVDAIGLSCLHRIQCTTERPYTCREWNECCLHRGEINEICAWIEIK